MGIFNKTNAIELKEEDLQDAKSTAGIFADEFVKHRAFANVIAARAALKLLFSLNIDATNLYSMYSINKILERIDIADIYAGEIRIDSRLVSESGEIFIPKSHFNLGIVPDLYVVFKINKEMSAVEFMGCINPEEMDKSKENRDYYFVDEDILYSLKIFKNLVKNSTGHSDYKSTDEELERAENLIIPLEDGEIFNADYEFLVKQLAYNVDLRRKTVEFENFEFISQKVVKEETIYGDSVLGLIGSEKLYNRNEFTSDIDLQELVDESVDSFVDDFNELDYVAPQMDEVTGEISLDDALSQMDDDFELNSDSEIAEEVSENENSSEDDLNAFINEMSDFSSSDDTPDISLEHKLSDNKTQSAPSDNYEDFVNLPDDFDSTENEEISSEENMISLTSETDDSDEDFTVNTDDEGDLLTFDEDETEDDEEFLPDNEDDGQDLLAFDNEDNDNGDDNFISEDEGEFGGNDFTSNSEEDVQEITDFENDDNITDEDFILNSDDDSPELFNFDSDDNTEALQEFDNESQTLDNESESEQTESDIISNEPNYNDDKINLTYDNDSAINFDDTSDIEDFTLPDLEGFSLDDTDGTNLDFEPEEKTNDFVINEQYADVTDNDSDESAESELINISEEEEEEEDTSEQELTEITPSTNQTQSSQTSNQILPFDDDIDMADLPMLSIVHEDEETFKKKVYTTPKIDDIDLTNVNLDDFDDYENEDKEEEAAKHSKEIDNMMSDLDEILNSENLSLEGVNDILTDEELSESLRQLEEEQNKRKQGHADFENLDNDEENNEPLTEITETYETNNVPESAETADTTEGSELSTITETYEVAENSGVSQPENTSETMTNSETTGTTEAELKNEDGSGMSLDDFLNSSSFNDMSSSDKNSDNMKPESHDNGIDDLFVNDNVLSEQSASENNPDSLLTDEASMVDNSENLYNDTSLDDKANGQKPKSKAPQLAVVLVVLMCAAVYVNKDLIMENFNITFPQKAEEPAPEFDLNSLKEQPAPTEEPQQEEEVAQEESPIPTLPQPTDMPAPEEPQEVADNQNQPAQPVAISQNSSNKITKLSWEVPEALANNDKIRKYLQIAGRTLKLTLQNDLLVATELPFSNKIMLDIKIVPSGNIASSDFIISSGSKQIDNIVLQSVKDTFKYVRPPLGEIQSPNSNITLIINF